MTEIAVDRGKHTPITKQRSEWILMEKSAPGMPWAKQYARRVSDGVLVAFVADEPQIGWHMSISFRDNSGKLSRYPRWDEIAHAREKLLPADIGFAMHLPPEGEFVALHSTTFHLHQDPSPVTEAVTLVAVMAQALVAGTATMEGLAKAIAALRRAAR